jgi:dipeptidyl aminopeptidase/acylaminoacyl peptidase
MQVKTKAVFAVVLLALISLLNTKTGMAESMRGRQGQSGLEKVQDDTAGPFLIRDFRAMKRIPEKIITMKELEKNKSFIRYSIVYTSHGLKITGMMNIPHGQGPFPTVILNHGHYDRKRYVIGAGFKEGADIFASNGYIAVGSDYRNHGASESGKNLFQHLGNLYDILSLLDAVKDLPSVDRKRIGMWGYSGGGWISLKAVVVDPIIKIAALFGSMSADDLDNYKALSKWHPEDIKVVNRMIGNPHDNPDTFREMSPIYFVKDMPNYFIIHRGENDTIIPKEWNERLRDRLLQEKKIVEFYTYPRQDHVLKGSAWDISMDRTIIFFKKYLRSN